MGAVDKARSHYRVISGTQWRGLGRWIWIENDTPKPKKFV